MPRKASRMQFNQDKLVILLVTCSLTIEREEICLKVTESLLNHFEKISDFSKFVNLDNGSLYSKHFSLLPKNVSTIKFKKNIGYWQALYWFLNKGIHELNLESCEYIYIVESDNFHTSLAELREVIKIMDDDETIISTRTQEFSVKYRWLYNKGNRFNPFRIKRSLISLKNLVSGEKAYFRKIPNSSKLYFTNLHAKLPAVHRTKHLANTFSKLQEMEMFTEFDFFRLIQLQNCKNAVLDGGIFHTLSNYKNSEIVQSGSWITNFQGEPTGYMPTRSAKINVLTDSVYNNYDISVSKHS